jgi:glucosamine kinase
MSNTDDCVIGLDVGGTQTRWALCESTSAMLGEGVSTGFSGARMHVAAERDAIAASLASLAASTKHAFPHARLVGLHAGVTGIGEGKETLVSMLAQAFALPEQNVAVTSDVELTYHGALAPGEGYLIYAGTGSIAAFIDETGSLFRAGGRGVQLDDAGGGYWIAREALRRIWRREDEQPGVWRNSPMAQALFAQVGGDSSIFSARFLMEQTRGAVGMLALHVAAHANVDPLAAAILNDAGLELARLAQAMTLRYGVRKIVVAGRASVLHPGIEAAMRQALPVATAIEFKQVQGHVAAAKLAAQKWLHN